MKPTASPRGSGPPDLIEGPPQRSVASAEALGGADFALWRRFPKLAAAVPRVVLTELPTPVEHLAELGQEIGVPQLYVKRDDLSAPGYGGGKPRKLEFYLGDALAQGRTGVVTWGGVGSNQAVATAAHAGALGMNSTLILLPQKRSQHVTDNLLAALVFGAQFELVQSQDRARARMAQLAVDGADQLGAYPIPVGGSTPLGTLGFINAAFELDEQIAAGLLPEPDALYIPMGTMGSAVGLAIGLAVAERRTRVVAVRASNLNTSGGDKFEKLFDETVAWLRLRDASFPQLSFAQAKVRLEGGQLGKGYGRPTPAAQAALQLTQATAGLDLETTYTGKAMAALIADAPQITGQCVLFYNTHNSRPLPRGEVADLPVALRGYVTPPGRAGK